MKFLPIAILVSLAIVGCGKQRTPAKHWIPSNYEDQESPKMSSEREPTDSLRDKSNVIGGRLPSLTSTFVGRLTTHHK